MSTDDARTEEALAGLLRAVGGPDPFSVSERDVDDSFEATLALVDSSGTARTRRTDLLDDVRAARADLDAVLQAGVRVPLARPAQRKVSPSLRDRGRALSKLAATARGTGMAAAQIPRSAVAGRPRAGTESRRVVVKVAVACVLGVAAFLLSLTLDTSTTTEVWLPIGVSVFVSGVAFVTQFLIDTEARVDKVATAVNQMSDRYEQMTDLYELHSLRTETLIREEFKKINAATELFGAVEASALKVDAATQLVRDATGAVTNSGPLAARFAEREIARLSSYLRSLSYGSDLTYEGEDRDWLLGLTEVATVSIDATSLTTVDAGGTGFVDGGLWSSDLGMRYLEAQREAVRRGVVIRRVFIVDRPGLGSDADLFGILHQQVACGVQVRVLTPTSMRLLPILQFAVVDGEIAYHSVPASAPIGHRPHIVTTSLVTEPTRVRDRIRQYTELWQAAESFDPPPTASQARQMHLYADPLALSRTEHTNVDDGF